MSKSSKSKAFKNAFDAVNNRVDQIIQYHKITDKSPIVADSLTHFTNWDVAQTILKKKLQKKGKVGIPMWATDAVGLNDPLEGRALIDFLHEYTAPKSPVQSVAFEDIENFFESITSAVDGDNKKALTKGRNKTYLTSFSRESNKLEMWIAYGDDGEGIAFSTPAKTVLEVIGGTKWNLYEVHYSKESKVRAFNLLWPVLKNAENAISQFPEDSRKKYYLEIGNNLSRLMYLYKHEQFSFEKEVRLVMQTSNWNQRIQSRVFDGRPTMYIETPPVVFHHGDGELVFGPKSIHAPNAIAYAETLLGQSFGKSRGAGKTVPTVRQSKIPYK